MLVAGGGPAGVTAAIAAAREGRGRSLIEQFGFLGGMATAGPGADVGAGHGSREAHHRRAVLVDHRAAQGEDAAHPAGSATRLDSYRPGTAQADPRAAGPPGRGEDPLPDATGGRAARADRHVTEAVICNKDGLSAIRAKVFIDTTGDADLVARAGGAFEKGDPQTGELQPVTPCFVMANVDAGPLLRLAGGKAQAAERAGCRWPGPRRPGTWTSPKGISRR